MAVIAGPGAGKTRTLIARLNYLLEERQIPPGEITAVTFTHKAAEEMRSRMAAGSFGDSGEYGERKDRCSEGVWIGTFHAICSRFLQEAGISFVVADEGLQMELAEKALREFRSKGTPGKFLQELSRMKNGLTQNIVFATADDSPEAADNTGKIFGSQKNAGLEKERGSEDQDINPLQYQLVKEWGRGGRELFVIGDPDQSIYGFRGCDPKAFFHLKEAYPELSVVRLEENYRSDPTILNAALGLISHNEGEARRMKAMAAGTRRIRDMVTETREEESLRMVSAEDERREAIFVAKEITRQIGGIDMLDTDRTGAGERHKVRGFSDIAVLYRTHRQVALLEKCLRQEGIPYLVAGREDFLREREVRAALYFFRHILYPGEEATGALCRRLLEPLLEEARLARRRALKQEKVCRDGF